ncbi:MAG: Hsp20/alpha crystallin family protein [Spirochaetaceae bacterium]|jgi:HSP20 family protein|nr:Hsp20/alpha crystallin family protein [Spirochaetaceae bacterium]
MKAVSLYRPLVVEKALNDFMESFFGESPITPSDQLLSYIPAVDIWEADGAYVLEAELPGYEEKDLEIHLDNRTLVIQSKKEEDTKKKDDRENEGRYYIRERRKSSFSRSFKLPEDADQESIKANFKNGLLCLEIKKRAEAQKRLISIGK